MGTTEADVSCGEGPGRIQGRAIRQLLLRTSVCPSNPGTSDPSLNPRAIAVEWFDGLADAPPAPPE